jgi:hypothetical protein
MLQCQVRGKIGPIGFCEQAAEWSIKSDKETRSPFDVMQMCDLHYIEDSKRIPRDNLTENSSNCVPDMIPVVILAEFRSKSFSSLQQTVSIALFICMKHNRPNKIELSTTLVTRLFRETLTLFLAETALRHRPLLPAAREEGRHQNLKSRRRGNPRFLGTRPQGPRHRAAPDGHERAEERPDHVAQAHAGAEEAVRLLPAERASQKGVQREAVGARSTHGGDTCLVGIGVVAMRFFQPRGTCHGPFVGLRAATYIGPASRDGFCF